VSTLLDRVGTTVGVTPSVERRSRPLLGYALLALLAYAPPLVTARGKVAADTKQYLYLDPGRLLSRAVSMWDPNVGMGTVTHQTIGYVFPMGPYYWIADKLGVPDWVAQRFWLGSMLFFAAAGMLYLLRTFGLRGPGVVVAALAYMLSPYVLDYAARISVLLLPWAALPWMIGVIRKALRAPIRGLASWRYPAIFALIVQIAGGVNATALLFAGLGPVLWIVYAWLVARDVTFRRALAVTVRTGVLTLLASLWWISGLRMQAAYGLDILRYTETVDAVARTSSPNEVLRGLGYWFFYGQDRLGPWIEAASTYTQVLRVIFAGYALTALALFGAAFVRWRHRVYFIAVLLVGVVIAVGAHPYKSPTPLGALFKSLASSSTAALAMRSTGRAVPLVVLALAVFLGLTTNSVSERLRTRGRLVFALAAPAVVIALLAVNFPALYNGTYYGKNLQRPEEIPSYWKQAVASLGDSTDTRVLEAPGSDFASYRWGNTVDPITPGLTDRPYVARELIPYGTAGTADLLNAFDRRLQEGVADPRGIAPLLRRMGVGTLLARNDIQYERYDLVPPRELARVLARTPGLEAPARYGPAVPAVPLGVQDEISLGAPPNEPSPAPVAVYNVKDPLPIVRAESNDHALMVSGDGEGLVDAADVGLLDQAGVVRYSASYASPGELRAATNSGATLVITDNNRLRARRWTSVKDNVGYTEQAGEADRPLDHDNGDARLPLFPNQQSSVYTTTIDSGAQRAVASAYGNTITYTPEDRAARALDGDPYTSWRANAFGDARGQQIRIDLEGPITTDHVNLVQPLTGGRNRWITEMELRFDGGRAFSVTLDPSSRTLGGQTVDFGRRTFEHLEVTVKQTSNARTNLFGKDDAVGFAEIRLRDERSAHDVEMREVLQMPTDLVDALGADAATHPIVLVMRRDAVRPVPPRSQPELSIDRRFTLPGDRTFVLTGNAEITPDAPASELQAAFRVPDAAHGGVSTSWSQFLFGCMKCTANNAIDGDPGTAWQTPFVGVRGEWMQFKSAAPLSFDHMDLRVFADGRHSVPKALRLDVDGRTRMLTLPEITDQPAENASTAVRLTFPRITGHTVRVTVADVREERSRRFATSTTDLMPVGISELGIPGLHLPAASPRIDSGCRSDLVAIDGTPMPVRITGRAATADQLMALSVTPCDPRDAARVPELTLGRGAHTLTSARGKDVGFLLDRLVLASGTVNAPVTTKNGVVTEVRPPAPPTPRLQVVRSGRTSVRVHVSGATTPFWMVLGESQSPGWHADVIGGRGLGTPQLVDGYANGWLVTPAASDFDITMEWTPQKQVRAALWISLLAAVVCLVIAGVTTRRRFVGGANVTADPDDAQIDIAWSWSETRDRGAWIAPLLAGVLTAITVAPWAGVLVAGVIAVVQWRPRLRGYVLVLPAAILFLCGAYVMVQQARHHIPPVFEWPTVFGRARTPAWIAVMLLAGDAIAQALRRPIDWR
jgi:arabinofuranan 3-O-arabinosyltransferase